jgi:hypothetical protein
MALNFRGSTQFPHLSLHERLRSRTDNVVKTCTFGRDKLRPYRCRLARGTISFLVGTLAADGVSSLFTHGKMHVSRVCQVYFGFIITNYDTRMGINPTRTYTELQVSAFGFDDIGDTRYECIERCCPKIFVGAQAHGNGVL